MWGYVPETHIVGNAGFIYFSWNSRVPMYRFFSKMRFGRIGDILL
jgi:hypothetical protein